MREERDDEKKWRNGPLGSNQAANTTKANSDLPNRWLPDENPLWILD